MGNGNPGFGRSPSYKTIKVTIVGFASPRWRGATEAEASRRNWSLSVQRAEATKAVVVAELRKHFGANVDIKFDVDYSGDTARQSMQVGSYGVGSAQTLAEAHGNRKDNSDYARRVEVDVEMVTSTGHEVGRSLPANRYSALTQFWYVAIKEIHVIAGGGAVGEVTLILRNSLSGKKMLAKATLGGGGLNTALLFGKRGAQWKAVGADVASMLLTKYPEASFYVSREIGFSDFEGTLIRLEKIDVKLGYGVTVIGMTMLGFGAGAEAISLLRKRGLGLPKLEGWVTFGTLHLQGVEPGDYWEDAGSEVTEMHYVDKSHNETLVINFETGSARLSGAAQSSVIDYIATWSRRMLAP